ncbi:methyltransferase domain-containing protein [Candidatus Pacearchaeota archaeon]|nr:methyltransferase domain-containing protein [Candidatus Pacearchaeota archaeon]
MANIELGKNTMLGQSEVLIRRIAKQAMNKLGYRISKVEPDIGSNLSKTNVNGLEELLENYEHYECLKLHFGCGPRILKGWINIDLAYEPYEKYMQCLTDKYYAEEIRGDRSDFFAIDITKVGLPLPDNSVDVIFHEDFLEHLNQRDQIIFLAETLRVLKPGGIHRVNTPSLVGSMQDHSDFTKGFAGVYVDEWDRWHHLNVLTPAMLEEMAKMVGYSKVIFNERDESTSTLVPLEYRPGADRPKHDGNIFADLIK